MTSVPKKPSRSGGPRTPAGKAVASQNALKAGVYTGHIILPGENEDDFLELEQQFQIDFHAQGVAEVSIVHELASLTWKRMRLERLEQRHILAQLERLPSLAELELAGVKLLKRGYRFIEDLALIDWYPIDGIRDVVNGLRELKAQKPIPQVLDRLKKNNLELYQIIAERAEALGLENPTPESICKSVYTKSMEQKPLLQIIVDDFLSDFEQDIWVVDHWSEVLRAIEQVKEQRLLNIMQNGKTKRAADDLARSFFRALDELRKQQNWRRKHQVIDVTPVSETKPAGISR
jgi:hypothetical protein